MGDCYPLTARIGSLAETVEQIIAETLLANSSERSGRLIDQEEPAAMERKKTEGYF
jgi:sulfate adenylyltransferase subunit 2